VFASAETQLDVGGAELHLAREIERDVAVTGT
jgi:hypothetical protein